MIKLLLGSGATQSWKHSSVSSPIPPSAFMRGCTKVAKKCCKIHKVTHTFQSKMWLHQSNISVGRGFVQIFCRAGWWADTPAVILPRLGIEYDLCQPLYLADKASLCIERHGLLSELFDTFWATRRPPGILQSLYEYPPAWLAATNQVTSWSEPALHSVTGASGQA